MHARTHTHTHGESISSSQNGRAWCTVVAAFSRGWRGRLCACTGVYVRVLAYPCVCVRVCVHGSTGSSSGLYIVAAAAAPHAARTLPKLLRHLVQFGDAAVQVFGHDGAASRTAPNPPEGSPATAALGWAPQPGVSQHPQPAPASRGVWLAAAKHSEERV